MPELTVIALANPTLPQLKLLERLPKSTEVVIGDSVTTVEKAAPFADVIFHWPGRRELLQEVWKMAPRVRWVHSMWAGLENVLFPELLESPVILTNGRGVFSQSLGEFVLGSILFFAKDFRRMIRSQEAGIWDPFDVEEVSRQTVGILGYGEIGRAVARRSKALGMKVLALRHRPELSSSDDPLIDELIPPENMTELMRRSDYLVAALPNTPLTRSLIGAPELRAMKPTAVIINVGRGPVIDEPALISALREKRIRGAALDVFETEPLPAGHAFFGLDNVLLSPHCADHTSDWLDQAIQLFLDNFERFQKGEPLRNVVNKKLGY
jgi:phosphoglycerate dehydrogenase-like enzyme